MPPSIIQQGDRYGRLLVREQTAERRKGQIIWLCWCECGEIVRASSYLLTTGKTKSCGCLRREMGATRGRASRRHGEASNGNASNSNETAEYRCWAQLKTRCNSLTHKQYPDYGGRGIKVCKRWEGSYEAFLEDMGRRPSPDHSLDRINNDRGYKPSNCRWATSEEQNNNRRDSVPRYPTIEIDGIHQSLTEWLLETGVNKMTYYRRLKRGMTPAEALLLG